MKTGNNATQMTETPAQPKGKILRFRTRGYNPMSVRPDLALKVHLNNLAETFGLDTIEMALANMRAKQSEE